MESDGVLAEVNCENFQEAIGGKFEEVLKRNQKNNDNKLQKSENSQKKKEALNIKLDELQLIKKLAEGQFGPIYLIKSGFN